MNFVWFIYTVTLQNLITNVNTNRILRMLLKFAKTLPYLKFKIEEY